MISSILDTDLYKLTMQQAVLQKFSRAVVRYNFINRGKTKFPKGFAFRLREEIINFCSNAKLGFSEKEFLTQRCYYLTPAYLDFLKGYRYNPAEVIVKEESGRLSVEITGYWYRTILWEVPLMAMISELYFDVTKPSIYPRNVRKHNNNEKRKFFVDNDIMYSEFGARRRYSYINQDEVIGDLVDRSRPNLIGTSNPHFARKHNLTPMGTQGHEWYMYHGAKYGYKVATQLALQNWIDVYQGNLGIALTDTYTSPVFLKSFNTMYSKLFDGIRQDSGDPSLLLRLAIKHYKNNRIDPHSKTILFSDGLNCSNIIQIKDIVKTLGSQIQDRYGIGTFLTNDIGAQPLNIVIKLTGIYEDGIWIPVVKLSDHKGKNTGDSKAVQKCKEELNIAEEINEKI